MSIGLVVIIGSAMSGNMPMWLKQMLRPVFDFNFTALTNITQIFSGENVYNVFGNPVSYVVASLTAGILLCAVVCLLTYIRQKTK
jgi:hypothetical protein